MLVEAAGRYLLLGVNREPHLLLRCLHGCRRRRRLFAWAFHGVRVGFICEPRRIPRPVLSFSMVELDVRCIDYQTKTGGRRMSSLAHLLGRGQPTLFSIPAG
jgi:hypothetical protein